MTTPTDAEPSTQTAEDDLAWIHKFAYSDLIANRESSLEHDGLIRVYMNYRALYHRLAALTAERDSLRMALGIGAMQCEEVANRINEIVKKLPNAPKEQP